MLLGQEIHGRVPEVCFKEKKKKAQNYAGGARELKQGRREKTIELHCGKCIIFFKLTLSEDNIYNVFSAGSISGSFLVSSLKILCHLFQTNVIMGHH